VAKRYRVLDFSRLLPGPYASLKLAQLGMDVTCAELPRMPELSRTLMPKLYRGKKRRPFEESMLRDADVILEGFRPGVMDRLGLGYARCRKLNPKLVYCSLAGWKKGRKAGHDINFLAATGWLGDIPAAPVSDMAGGLNAAFQIVGALLKGKGCHLKLSLEAAAEEFLLLPKCHEKGPKWWLGESPFYRLYETKDGGKVAVGALEPRFQSALRDFLGEEPSERVFKAKPAAQWEKLLAPTDFCVNVVKPL
jgi:alpha-methylacyl-CoA racemase